MNTANNMVANSSTSLLIIVIFVILFFIEYFPSSDACTIDANIVTVSKYIGETTAGTDVGSVGTATFTNLGGIGADSSGNLYVTERANCLLRRIIRSNPSNPVSETYMGTDCASSSHGTGKGSGSFLVTDSGFTDVINYLDSPNEYIFVLGENNIRKIDITDPEVPIMEDAGSTPFAGVIGNFDYHNYILGNSKSFVPVTNTLGNDIFTPGYILVGDGESQQLRVVSNTGDVTAFSGYELGLGYIADGNPSSGGPIDGGSPVSFVGLQGVAFVNSSTILVCDTDSNSATIRIVLQNGFIYNVGSGDPNQQFLGRVATRNHCDGVSSEVELKDPKKIVRDPEGFFVFIDENKIKKLVILPDGQGKVSTLAGTDSGASFQPGISTNAILPGPTGLTIVENTVFISCPTLIAALDFVPPSQPGPLSIISNTSTTITIEFGNSQYDGGPTFQHYKYVLKDSATDTIVDTVIMSVEIDAALSPHTFTDLTPGNSYEILEYGVNRVGDSDPSTLSFIMPLECFNISFTNSSVCNSHGECTSPDVCNCDAGYDGPSCNIYKCYDKFAADLDVCSGHGKCLSIDNCQCDSGYTGNECEEYQCFGIEHDILGVCSGFGSCDSPDNCTCDEGYFGDTCDSFECFGVEYTNSSYVCSGHGTCSSPDFCTCSSGYTTPNCSESLCNGKYGDDACGGPEKGVCTSPNSCTCNPGYNGVECSQYTCDGRSYLDSLVCNQNGDCVKPDTCECHSGFSGDFCDVHLCYNITSDDSTVCSSHGACISPDNCDCDDGYITSNCAYTLFDCFEISPSSGEIVVDPFTFQSLSDEIVPSSYSYYIIHPDTGEVIDLVTSSSNAVFYPPIISSNVRIGGIISTSLGTANISSVITVNDLSEIYRTSKEDLLVTSSAVQNLQSYYKYDCTKKSYISNLMYFTRSVEIAYDCSNTSFSIDSTDLASYSIFEANIVGSSTCSLSSEFRNHASDRTSGTLVQHASILKCMSNHTTNPTTLLNHLQDNIQSESSTQFSEVAFRDFMYSASNMVDYLFSPFGMLNRVTSELQASAILTFISAMVQKMENFVPVGTSFSTIVSTTNFHVSIVRNTVLGLPAVSNFQLPSSMGTVGIDVPSGIVTTPLISDIISLRGLVLEYDPSTWTTFSLPQNISSILVSLQIYSAYSSTLPLQFNDDYSVIYTIPGSYNLSIVQSSEYESYAYKCLEWNSVNKRWSDEACSLDLSLSSSTSMTCQCKQTDGVVGVGLRWTSHSSVVPPGSADTPGAWISSNWIIPLSLVLLLLLALILILCCITCCLIICLCCTRRRKKKQIEPASADNDFKGVFPKSAWDEVVEFEASDEGNEESQFTGKKVSSTISGTSVSVSPLLEETPYSPPQHQQIDFVDSESNLTPRDNLQPNALGEIPIMSFDEASDEEVNEVTLEVEIPAELEIVDSKVETTIEGVENEDEMLVHADEDAGSTHSDIVIKEIRSSSRTNGSIFVGDNDISLEDPEVQYNAQLSKQKSAGKAGKKKKKGGNDAEKKKIANKKRLEDRKKVSKLINQKMKGK